MNRSAVRLIVAPWLLAALLPLAGCGVETATTAATSAEIKKREMEAGKQTMDRAQNKAEEAAQLMQQRAEQTGAAADK